MKSFFKFGYRLGIDVGVASLGIAVLPIKKMMDPLTRENEYGVAGGSVRIYTIPEGAEERRNKRGMRRNIERRARRLDRLSELLHENGIGVCRKDISKELLNKSPITLRAKASSAKVELDEFARALLHIARHRGSSAIRETDESDDKSSKNKKGIVSTGIETLRNEMKAKNFKTYGQFLRWREKKNLPVRIKKGEIETGKDGYVFYPSRKILKDEFDIIWKQQQTYHGDVLTNELKDKVSKELFFQRAVTSPPPGKCPFIIDDERLAKTSRLFQVRRIYEDVNHLKFYEKSGLAVEFNLQQRDMIVDRLMAGDDLSLAEIKTFLGLKRTDKASIEDGKGTSKIIKGYPFDKALGDDEVLGDQWHQASEEIQDKVLHIIASIHDDDLACEQLQSILNCDHNTAKNVLEVPLPKGYGRMGKTATIKILDELKKDITPARIAQDQANLIHFATPDGVVYDSLPYYGEVLVGHTTPPMWVSDYRRKSDTSPHTNSNEDKLGRIPNPVVHLALNQIRKAVNATIKRYGIPESIHIELARELNKGAEEREKIAKQQDDNAKENHAIRTELARINVNPQRLNIQKYKLWKEQKSKCVYTGKAINVEDLYNGTVDVDHILPRSKTYSDSMANKVVCLRHANAYKDNRAPFDAFANNPDYDWDAIMRSVDGCMPNKKWRFRKDAMGKFTEEGGFRERYGNDNSYIAKVAMQYLSCLYGEPSKVIAVSSHIVAMLRGKWGLNRVLNDDNKNKKSRDDHRHHFIDAFVTACVTRGMVQKIQREAARCEREHLESFIKKIDPPFGDETTFFNTVKKITLENVTLSRKADHSLAGQLHEDTLIGIVENEPDRDGKYVCRKRKKLTDYKTLEELKKPKIENTLPNIDEINKAREDLESLKETMANLCDIAKPQLEDENRKKIADGKKDRKITPNAIFKRAVKIQTDAKGKSSFIIFEKNKLVNIRYSTIGNKEATGGYISGRNHHKDFYLNSDGKLKWQLINMLKANNKDFVPESSKSGNKLLWSTHKDDMLLIDDPDDTSDNPRRIRVVVAKMTADKIGVVPEVDARDSKQRITWEYGLSFFCKLGAQRIVTDEIGNITWHFPMLPRNGNVSN